jgi:hypothetical protein
VALVTQPAAEDALGYKRWLFVLSRKEFSESLKLKPGNTTGQPVDTVLLTLILSHMAGQSEAIDDRIAHILSPSTKSKDTGPVVRTVYSPRYGYTPYITRQLHDLLSNDYSYRQFVVNALVDIYRKSKSEILRTNIANFAPAIPVRARELDADGGLPRSRRSGQKEKRPGN